MHVLTTDIARPLPRSFLKAVHLPAIALGGCSLLQIGCEVGRQHKLGRSTWVGLHSCRAALTAAVLLTVPSSVLWHAALSLETRSGTFLQSRGRACRLVISSPRGQPLQGCIMGLLNFSK